MTPSYWKTAQKHLSAADTIMGSIISSYEGEFLKTRGDAFYTLARSIAGQQISVKAADAVWGKLESGIRNRESGTRRVLSSPPEGERLRSSPQDEGRSVGGKKKNTPHDSLRSSAPPQGGSYLSPEAILALSDAELRACGLSGQKVNYLRHLAEFFQEDDIHDGFWDAMEDEEVIAHITQIKGIGRWTAEMFLIFHLQRPDVFPVDDLGLQKAIWRHYGDAMPRLSDDAGKNKRVISSSHQRIIRQAEAWRPYRTVATWYLWRALDPLPVEY